MYPALTVLEALDVQLRGMNKQLVTLWVGTRGGMEAELVTRKGIPFESITAAGIHGVGLRALPGNIRRLNKGYRESRRILNNFKPEVIFFTGGYVAVPMSLAAKMLSGKSIAQVLYVPDIEPGLAIKTLARFADGIALTTQDSMKYFSTKVAKQVAGYPVRQELVTWSKEDAYQVFNLEQGLPILLVLGGSTGAQSINQALMHDLPRLLNHLQIIHISGQRNWSDVENMRNALEENLARRYHAFPYLHEEMGAALRSADLVLSRAGASCLGEYPLFGLPAVLVPYPYAWRYQQVNAQYLTRHGAAIILDDADLPSRLSKVLLEIFNDSTKLASMRSAMLKLAQPDAANRIATFTQQTVERNRSRT